MTAVGDVQELPSGLEQAVESALTEVQGAMARARASAAALLGCREHATAQEVRAAFRRRVLEERPDVGGADGQWLDDLKQARALLLAAAAPEIGRAHV